MEHVTNRDIGAVRWFHTMDLGGHRTDGQYRPDRTLRRLRLPRSLSGLSVLDVGAWDGYYAFEAERRGAESVVATDSYCWSGAGWGDRRGFDLAHSILRSNVEAIDCEPHELGEVVNRQFDIVLFLGVLYHLRDPMPALSSLRTVTKGVLILETEALVSSKHPELRVFPGRELNDDPTNWLAPSPLMLHHLLLEAGFTDVELVWRRRISVRALRAALRCMSSIRLTLRQQHVDQKGAPGMQKYRHQRAVCGRALMAGWRAGVMGFQIDRVVVHAR